MHKVINSAALIFFILLVVNVLQLPDILLNFLIVGALPGTTTTLSPTMMLAIMTTCSGIVIFELLARRFHVFRQIRYYVTHLVAKQSQLPKRRFTRV